MDRPNGHVTRQEFNDRIDRLEDKIDVLMRRVAFVYGFAAGISIVVTLVTQVILV